MTRRTRGKGEQREEPVVASGWRAVLRGLPKRRGGAGREGLDLRPATETQASSSQTPIADPPGTDDAAPSATSLS